MRTGVIYIVTNLINGKQYVGQTIQYDGIGHGKLIQLAYKKYGKSNFRYEILEETTQNRLDELEIYFIKECNTVSPIGYNLESGGQRGKKLHYTTRKIMSNKAIGRIGWNRGLTKHNDNRLREAGMIHSVYRSNNYWPGWNRGLTKHNDNRLREAGEKISATKQSLNMPAWNKGLTGIYSEYSLNKIRNYALNHGNFVKNNPMNDEKHRKTVSDSKRGRKIYIDEFGKRKYTPRQDK